VLCDCGKRLKAPDWMAGRSTQCPACWAAVNVPKRGWFRFGANSKKRRRKRAASGDRNNRPLTATPPGDFAPLQANPADNDTVTSNTSEAGLGPSRDHTIVLPQKRPGPTNRKTTFVPSRPVTDGDDYRPNSIMLRSQPRWVKLLPDSTKQHWYSSLL